MGVKIISFLHTLRLFLLETSFFFLTAVFDKKFIYSLNLLLLGYSLTHFFRNTTFGLCIIIQNVARNNLGRILGQMSAL